jgi:hypothetical protein
VAIRDIGAPIGAAVRAAHAGRPAAGRTGHAIVREDFGRRLIEQVKADVRRPGRRRRQWNRSAGTFTSDGLRSSAAPAGILHQGGIIVGGVMLALFREGCGETKIGDQHRDRRPRGVLRTDER